jgi:predicted nuclease of predicted toxin-antitoxin system
LISSGYDAIHTFDLPRGNRTADSDICAVADDDGRIVITKDDDFTHSFFVRHEPNRLLLVGTGNISNAELLELFADMMPRLSRVLSEHRFVELSAAAILIHE